MASFQFAEDCGPRDFSAVDSPASRGSDGFEYPLPRPLFSTPPRDLIFDRGTVAQLEQSAADGAVIETLSAPAPEPARAPGSLLPLAILVGLAWAASRS